jgi:signal transduction histidine kinase
LSLIEKFWAQPLRRQLLLADLLLLVPVLGLVAWSALSTRREIRDELISHAQVVATTTAAYVNRDIQNFDHMADQLTGDPSLRALDAARIPDLLNRAVVGRAMISAIAVVDASGREVSSVGTLPDATDERLWPRRTTESRRRTVEPIRTQQSGPGYVVFGYPIESSGQLSALGVYVLPSNLQQALQSLDLPPSSVVFIADDDGRILAQSARSGHEIGQQLYGPGNQLNEARTHKGPDGIERIHAEARIAAGPWIVSVGVPSSLVRERAGSIWTRGLIILSVVLAGGFLVTWFLAFRLRESVGHLSGTASRIASGDFSPMQSRPMLSAEFAQLQVAFAGMLERFNKTKSALDGQMAEERRIRQELESLQGQVIRQERLAAVGQLVSGVAHEINNPLQAILGFSELLQMQPDVSETVKADLRLIQKESARACGIIRNLALFARQQPGEAGPMMMSDVIRAVAELRQRRLESEDIELQLDDRARRPVTAVLAELQQVVLNFVINAEQSIIASGRLPGRITIRSYDKDDRVVLEVEDTGPGVAPANEAKLFQPFFTTKPVGQGTGLGLSISYGIVDSLGGGIGYRRAAAGGSIFYFDLPARAMAQVP